MTNLELAQYCKNTECRKCDVDIKKQCLQNDCWKAEKISDRCCPAVYYGVLQRHENEQIEAMQEIQ